jgi:hypothetical protein
VLAGFECHFGVADLRDPEPAPRLPEHFLRLVLAVTGDLDVLRHETHALVAEVLEVPVPEDAVPPEREVARDRLLAGERAVFVDHVLGVVLGDAHGVG